jgi:DNA-binding CsgD family transcriptional regulator
LSDQPEAPIRIDLGSLDEGLAEHLQALLAEVPGLEIVSDRGAADVRLVPARRRPNGKGHGLTLREQEVLIMLAEGASNKAIARRLGISVHTAKFHVASVIDKLDAAGRTDAVAHAMRLGLVVL